MKNLPTHHQMLVIGLSALAGYVDAIGFLGTGGLFVSFMSGNSTRAGVGLVDQPGLAIAAAALIAGFVLGVMVATLIGGRAGTRRQPATLALVTLCLAVAAGIGPAMPPLACFALVAFAMGASNMLFESNGEVRFGVTYMTGTLVKIGQRLAYAAQGGPPFGWLPFLLLWLGLGVGAIAGALSFHRMGMAALWIAAAIAFLATLMMLFEDHAARMLNRSADRRSSR